MIIVFRGRSLLRKDRVEYDIGDQFDRFGRIAFERRGMDYRLFLGRIGIQFPAEVFETAVDVVGFAVCRAFENECSSRWAKPYSDGNSSRLPVLTVSAQCATAERTRLRMHRMPLGSVYWIRSMPDYASDLVVLTVF